MSLYLHLCTLLAINIVLVVGLGIPVGAGGIVALNGGAMMAVGAYAYGVLTVSCHWPSAIAFLAAGAIGGCVTWLLSELLVRLRFEDLVMGTLAVQLVLSSLVSNLDAVTGGVYGMPGIPALVQGAPGGAAPVPALAPAGIAALVLVGLWRLYKSPFVRILRATRDAPIDTLLLGRDLAAIRVRALVCAGVAAGAAGALFASYMTYLDPTSVDLNASVTVVAAVIIGGAGTFSGAVIGATFITLVPELLRLSPATQSSAPALQQILFGALIVFCMLKRPQGLRGDYAFRQGR